MKSNNFESIHIQCVNSRKNVGAAARGSMRAHLSTSVVACHDAPTCASSPSAPLPPQPPPFHSRQQTHTAVTGLRQFGHPWPAPRETQAA